jgi:hypothetical protein
MDQSNEDESVGMQDEPVQDEGELTIPKNSKELKACLDCGLLLNQSQVNWGGKAS